MNMLFDAVRPLSPGQALERLMRQPISAMMTTVRGLGGDDGSLQSLGTALQVPVVGSSAATCQQTFHKELCAAQVKDVVSTPLSFHFKASEPTETIIEDIREFLLPPFFIKPASDEGSSGVEEVTTLDELYPAIERAKAKGDIMIQERSRGAELTLTLFEDEQGKVQVLPPTMVVPQKTTFYDQLAKRRPGRVVLHTPEAADHPTMWEAEAIARDVYDKLDCHGYASFDMVSDAGNIELLEVNTVPTLTSVTPLRHQLHAAGLHPTRLVDSLLSRTVQ